MKRSMALTAAACFCLDRQIPIFGEKPQTFCSPTRWFDSCFKCSWFSVRAGDTHLRRVTEMFFSVRWQVSRACCGSVAEAESRGRPARGRRPCQVGAVSLQNLPYRHQLYSAFWNLNSAELDVTWLNCCTHRRGYTSYLSVVLLYGLPGWKKNPGEFFNYQYWHMLG